MGGSVTACSTTGVRCKGLEPFASVGDLCWIGRDRDALDTAAPEEHAVLAEVMALQDDHTVLLPYDELDGVSLGHPVWMDAAAKSVRPDESWRGRVLDAMARPIDSLGPLRDGNRSIPLMARPIAAHQRTGLGERMHLGVKAMDLFTPCCFGQRLGIFAGSGVGKSTLISMIAQQCDADVMVIGLIGERGRELHDFLEHTLGAEGRQNSVVIAATSDMPAMMRRRAAYLSLAVAEYFRDCGLRVLCLLDSVTRFAMALREIYLAAGEPPTTKGYPPSVFAELPRLLERAGPGSADGSITGLFSVLVEGDDTNEPVSDTVRGILDGHVIMDRRIAERGRFPAIDVLQSVSRTAPGCYAAEERHLIEDARRLMRTHAEMIDLIQLGAYQPGSNAEIDRAIRFNVEIESLLRQSVADPGDSDTAWQDLEALLRP
jgi:flagellum-specific ATP synthase